MSNIDNIFGQIGAAREYAARGSRITVGRHRLVLREYGINSNSQAGPVVYASFSVLESPDYAVGAHVSQAWLVSQPGWQGEQAQSRAQAFLRALLGIADPSEAGRKGHQLCEDSQPGRGIQVVAHGVETKTDFVDVNWDHVQQTPEDVHKLRAWLDETAPRQSRRTTAAPQPAPQAQQATAQQATAQQAGAFSLDAFLRK